jgi:hypothetical protein
MGCSSNDGYSTDGSASPPPARNSSRTDAGHRNADKTRIGLAIACNRCATSR